MIVPRHPFRDMFSTLEKPLRCPHCNESLRDTEAYIYSKREMLLIQLTAMFGLAAILWIVLTM